MSNRAPRIRPMALALLAAIVCSACSMHAVEEHDRPPPMPLPEAFSATGGAQAPERWWTTFSDPGLNALIDRALQRNLDLQQAWARLDQVASLAAQAGALQWPNLQYALGFGATRQTFNFGRLVEISNVQFSAVLQAGYEVDLWGRVGHTSRAAGLDYEATREEVSAAALSIAARVTDLWFQLAEANAQLGLLAEQRKVSTEYTKLVELRFAQGLASALDVQQQRGQVAAIDASQPLLQARVELLTHQLNLLLAQAPTTALGAPPVELPDPGPIPATGVPADLLRRRPDLLAQEKRLLAADHRVGVAVAARLPSLSIGGRTGIQATNPDNVGQIFQQPVFGLNVDLVGPIIDGGRRAEEVKRVEAAVRDALAAMKSTLLRAITEVEDALTNERSQRAYLDKLDAQLQLARDTLGEARRRYANGLVDYLPVLSALAAVQQLERTRITAQRNVLAARISLHSALGGSWGDDLEGGDTIRAKKAEKAHDGDAAMTETPR